ncbi:MAG: ATP-binding protein [Magnetococcales bacterium]|nr:ATP-binding protein [Magnetococcales bacterium]
MTESTKVERLSVKVHDDHVERLTKAKPIQALAELIWNAFDADASRVDVELEYDTVFESMKSVTVRDDGHGISHEDARNLFTGLGGSWKAAGGAKSKSLGRMLHGKAGQGRFKALALGRIADWDVIYGSEDGYQSFRVTINKDCIREIVITEPQAITSGHSGVAVRISDLDKHWKTFEDEKAHQSLAEMLALYLTDYSDITVSLRGIKVDPSLAIYERTPISLPDIEVDHVTYPVRLEIIEWRTASERVLYLCDSNGFPLSRHGARFHTGDFHFSAYLKSAFIGKLNEENTLDLEDMHPNLKKICDEARKAISAHFRDRSAERAQSVIAQWKEEDVYPFQGEPATPIENVERKVFDIVAVSVNDYLPDFPSMETKTKAFHLRMLRQGVEKNPEDLQVIMSEVLNLPPKKQRELAELLQETTLSAIITASKLVADRIKFLDGLETILFDPELKQHFKERSQLHKLLEQNTWIFGEEFHLTASDQGLTEVLRAHARQREIEIQIDAPVSRVDGRKGIVDLMLSRKVPRNHANELEHLVVELKAPAVTIGSKEITQVKEYAFAVANDDRFKGAETRWTFWVISNAMDKFAQTEARQGNRPEGVIYVSPDGDNPRITIWAKMWGQVIRDSRERHRFFREALEHQVDKGASLHHLQKTYENLLKGVVAEEPAISETEPLEEESGDGE